MYLSRYEALTQENNYKIISNEQIFFILSLPCDYAYQINRKNANKHTKRAFNGCSTRQIYITYIDSNN